MVLARPPDSIMRGYGVRGIQRGRCAACACARAHTTAAIGVGLGLGVVSAAAFYYVVFFAPNAKHRRIEAYDRTYDPYKALERMCAKNRLHACPENLAKLAEAKGRKVPQ
ncbi:unnamed protein product [Sphagnum balticum]